MFEYRTISSNTDSSQKVNCHWNRYVWLLTAKLFTLNYHRPLYVPFLCSSSPPSDDLSLPPTASPENGFQFISQSFIMYSILCLVKHRLKRYLERMSKAKFIIHTRSVRQMSLIQYWQISRGQRSEVRGQSYSWRLVYSTEDNLSHQPTHNVYCELESLESHGVFFFTLVHFSDPNWYFQNYLFNLHII